MGHMESTILLNASKHSLPVCKLRTFFQLLQTILDDYSFFCVALDLFPS